MNDKPWDAMTIDEKRISAEDAIKNLGITSEMMRDAGKKVAEGWIKFSDEVAPGFQVLVDEVKRRRANGETGPISVGGFIVEGGDGST